MAKGKVGIAQNIKRETVLINKQGKVEQKGESIPEVLSKKYGKKNPLQR